MRNEKGVILISFLILALLLLVSVGAFYGFGYADIRASMRNEWLNQALYMAEAGVDQKLYELGSGNTSNISKIFNFYNQPNHQGAYSVFYGIMATCQDFGSPYKDEVTPVNPNTGACHEPVNQFALGDNLIFSTGTLTVSGVQQAQKEVWVSVRPVSLINPQAAVTISGVTTTTGGITVDGREHDKDGNLTGESGVFGISTPSTTFTQQGNSRVGGNGIAPKKPANPNSYEVNGPAVPNTPEAVLGLNPGALDSYKTNVPPIGPFNGVVYLTTSWTSADLDGSSGVLIVHNAAGNAALKNVHGTFKGLIVTDDIININSGAKLIGAVVGMKSDGVTVGNGNADILYSYQVISSLPLANYTVTSWQDNQNI